jgi:hypothetical protein
MMLATCGLVCALGLGLAQGPLSRGLTRLLAAAAERRP